MNIKNEILEWENLTNKLTSRFLYDYFDDEDPDYWWVANDIGGVFNYGDYWFDFNTVLILKPLATSSHIVWHISKLYSLGLAMIQNYIIISYKTKKPCKIGFFDLFKL